MKRGIHRHRSIRHPLSFEEVIVQRAAKMHGHAVRSASHGAHAREVAVEDGAPLPMIHFTDVGRGYGCLS